MKIVTPEEMRRIEQLAISIGSKESDFMDRAAEKITKAVEEYIYERNLPKRVLLLAGKGNNGADGYTAGVMLMAKGVFVKAVQVFPHEESSPLCLERHDQFVKAGGEVTGLSLGDPNGCALILDGLVGTGFKGKANGPLKDAIEWANKTTLPILAIDIPSGLDGTTGSVETAAIVAKTTVFLGLPKIGFFIGKGWDHVGKLVSADFGLPAQVIQEAKPEAELLEPTGLKLPVIQRCRHKYQAGYVLAIAGSKTMPGAADLSSKAALRSGAGMVRLFSDASRNLISEVICEPFDLKRMQDESKRSSAFLIGPGLGRDEKAEKIVQESLSLASLPLVLDADALFFLAKNRSWKIPKNAVLTPHHQEMERLLEKPPLFSHCQEFVDRHQCSVVLKGAPTVIFHPNRLPIVCTEGDPGMATAGSGDVLTGIIAGLLAQKMTPLDAAILGVYLHGYAGKITATKLTSYCMIASDLLTYLPDAFTTLQL